MELEPTKFNCWLLLLIEFLGFPSLDVTKEKIKPVGLTKNKRIPSMTAALLNVKRNWRKVVLNSKPIKKLVIPMVENSPLWHFLNGEKLLVINSSMQLILSPSDTLPFLAFKLDFAQSLIIEKDWSNMVFWDWVTVTFWEPMSLKVNKTWTCWTEWLPPRWSREPNFLITSVTLNLSSHSVLEMISSPD